MGGARGAMAAKMARAGGAAGARGAALRALAGAPTPRASAGARGARRGPERRAALAAWATGARRGSGAAGAAALGSARGPRGRGGLGGGLGALPQPRGLRTDGIARAVDEDKGAGAAKEAEVDIWRDTPIRYLGYANECGEAFKAFLPGWGVPASYAVAISYVLADTVDKAAKEWKSPAECSTGVRVARVAASATDALTWQLLASVFWPGSVIHLIVAASTKTLENLPGIPAAAATAAEALPVDVSGPILLAAIPTALGLITIPFIVEPIDEAVHKVCDASVRPAFKYATRAYAKSDAGTPTEGPEWEGEDQIDFSKAALGAGILAGALALPPALFALSDFVEAL